MIPVNHVCVRVRGEGINASIEIRHVRNYTCVAHFGSWRRLRTSLLICRVIRATFARSF